MYKLCAKQFRKPTMCQAHPGLEQSMLPMQEMSCLRIKNALCTVWQCATIETEKAGDRKRSCNVSVQNGGM